LKFSLLLGEEVLRIFGLDAKRDAIILLVRKFYAIGTLTHEGE
jgi:hypothetical protein